MLCKPKNKICIELIQKNLHICRRQINKLLHKYHLIGRDMEIDMQKTYLLLN